MINNEEQNGKKFYNIAEDYAFATEKLYQSIIENKDFKGGDKMKKGIRVGIYILNFLLMFLILILFDYIFDKNIDWTSAIIMTSVLTIADIVGVKKYIEHKSGKKFTRKQNISHFIITILIMIISLFGYYSIKLINDSNKNPNDNILEMSIKKSLIDIAGDKYQKDNNYIYAESHKIIESEIKNNKIYTYVVANYGLIDSTNCKIIKDTKTTLTMIYNKSKNKEGIYELKEYKENSIPDNLKEKANVDYEDTYFKSQINSYCNK